MTAGLTSRKPKLAQARSVYAALAYERPGKPTGLNLGGSLQSAEGGGEVGLAVGVNLGGSLGRRRAAARSARRSE